MTCIIKFDRTFITASYSAKGTNIDTLNNVAVDLLLNAKLTKKNKNKEIKFKFEKKRQILAQFQNIFS